MSRTHAPPTGIGDRTTSREACFWASDRGLAITGIVTVAPVIGPAVVGTVMMDSEAVAIFAVIADGTAKVSEAATISAVGKASVVADSSSMVALVSEAARGLTAAASVEVKDPTEVAASTVVEAAVTTVEAAAIVAAVAGPVVAADRAVVADRMAAGTDSPLTIL